MNYNYDGTKSDSQIKSLARREVEAVITKALIEAYGKDNVAPVKDNGGNRIAARIGKVHLREFSGVAPELENKRVDLCVTIGVSSKDFIERKTKTKTYEPFNFNVAAFEKEIL